MEILLTQQMVLPLLKMMVLKLKLINFNILKIYQYLTLTNGIATSKDDGIEIKANKFQYR